MVQRISKKQYAIYTIIGNAEIVQEESEDLIERQIASEIEVKAKQLLGDNHELSL